MQRILLGIGLATTIGLVSVPSFPAAAVRLSDGKVHFVQPPRLEKASTTRDGAYAWNATYYFTLTLPENAGEPLQQVVISQREGVEFPRFWGNGAIAFEGDPDRDGARLPIRSVDVDARARTVTVNFDPPVPPGRTLTIALHPVRNPIGGIYLFGVTAVPAGDVAQGQFLGYGRIHIYDNNRGVFWRSPFRRW